jgi:hypothetical protein
MMLPDPPSEKDPDRRALLIALVVSLLLHVATIFGFGRIAHGGQPPPLDVMNVQLVTDPTSPSEANAQPKQFTELPPDRADKNPDKPELLSNVTSRARDLVAGGNDNHPKAQEAGDPMVSLERKGASNPSTAPPAAPQTGAATGSATGSKAANGLQDPTAASGASASSTPRQAQSSSPKLGATGNSDIFQPDMGDLSGNAAITGDISLNTIAWDYAPWLERYKRRLLERWIAPPAYYMGLYPDGAWVVMEVEVAPSGKVLRCDQLGQQGAGVLVSAADNAVRYLSPIDPLPAGFPEPTLILRIRMIYPRVRRK